MGPMSAVISRGRIWSNARMFFASTGQTAASALFCNVPKPDLCSAAKAALFDHLVGAQEERWRDYHADRTRCL
jgi:hypothetical protein